MVVTCWVKGCRSKFDHDTNQKRSFFFIPKVREHEGEQSLELTKKRRRQWIANINREKEPSATARICSAHFISGKPSYLYDSTNPDWAPTLNLPDTSDPPKSIKKENRTEIKLKRYERRIKRQKQTNQEYAANVPRFKRKKLKDKHSAAKALIELAGHTNTDTVSDNIGNFEYSQCLGVVMEELKRLVLYVTETQENAIKALYRNHGWQFHADLNSDMTEGEGVPYTSDDIETDDPAAVLNAPQQKPTKFYRVRMNAPGDSLKVESADDDQIDSESPDKVDTISVQEPMVQVTKEHEYSLKPDTIEDTEDAVQSRNPQSDTKVIENKNKRQRVKKNTVVTIHKCPSCSYSSNVKSNYQRHITEVHSTRHHKCSHCPKVFKSVSILKAHEHHAHSEKILCDKCDKTFTSRSGYLNHNKQVHLNKALYQCEICDTTFTYKAHFKGHMSSHTSAKPFSCEACGKSFRYKSSLSFHKKSHCSGVKQEQSSDDSATDKKKKFLCDICGDELSSNYSLKIHREFVHSDRPKAQCSLCDKQFKGFNSLKRHIKVAHTKDEGAKYHCEICGKMFNMLTILQDHIRRHKKEYSVFCKTCGKGFYSNFKLKEHDRIHTGEKPFVCTLCNNFKCASKANLLKHMKNHNAVKRNTKKNSRAQQKEQSFGNAQEVSLDNNCVPLTGETTKIIVLESFPVDNVFDTVCSQNDIQNSQAVPNDNGDGGSLSNFVAMEITNDMNVYNSEQYGQNHLIPGDGNGFDPHINGDGFYGNMSMNTPTNEEHVSQGLNILNVAMNIVNQDSYEDV